jgi:hypothetical protein
MSAILLHALAVHAAAAGHFTAQQRGYLAAGVPDPPAQAPPGLTKPVDTILGWIKWGTLIGGSVGLSMCAVKMMVGHRNRSSMAADGASGIPWVLLGLSLAAVSSGVVGVFL